eukprot:3186181-Prymnesium_polylepis.1
MDLPAVAHGGRGGLAATLRLRLVPEPLGIVNRKVEAQFRASSRSGEAPEARARRTPLLARFASGDHYCEHGYRRGRSV